MNLEGACGEEGKQCVAAMDALAAGMASAQLRDAKRNPFRRNRAEETRVEETVLQRLRHATTVAGHPLLSTPPLEALARTVAATLVRALNGGLQSNRGTCFVVVGQKGTGKTSLLRARAGEEGALATALPDRVHAVYVSMNEVCAGTNPLQLLRDALGLAPVASEAVGDVLRAANDKLWTDNKALVLLLDEYQAAYAEKGGNHDAWRRFVYNIPASSYPRPRRIFAVVGGSRAWLRALSFGKAKVQEAQEFFPGYTGEAQHMNLNSQRFICRSLDALSMEECHAVLKKWHMPKRTDEFYFATGGVLGLMEMYLAGEAQTYQRAKLTATTRWDTLLQAMVQMLDQNLQQRSDSKVAATARELMQPLPVADLCLRCPTPAKDLYQASDEGYIRYDDDAGTVSFASPALAAYMVELLHGLEAGSWLTPYMRLCLVYPYGQLGIDAEEALRRGVAEKILKESGEHFRNDATFKHKVAWREGVLRGGVPS
jgi:hypothetical protein